MKRHVTGNRHSEYQIRVNKKGKHELLSQGSRIYSDCSADTSNGAVKVCIETTLTAGHTTRHETKFALTIREAEELIEALREGIEISEEVIAEDLESKTCVTCGQAPCTEKPKDHANDDQESTERICELVGYGLDAQEIFETLIMEGIHGVDLEYITALRTEVR